MHQDLVAGTRVVADVAPALFNRVKADPAIGPSVRPRKIDQLGPSVHDETGLHLAGMIFLGREDLTVALFDRVPVDDKEVDAGLAEQLSDHSFERVAAVTVENDAFADASLL